MRLVILSVLFCLCWAAEPKEIKTPPEIESADKSFQQECQKAYQEYQKALKVAAARYKDALEKKAKPALVRRMDTDGILLLKEKLDFAEFILSGEDIDLGDIAKSADAKVKVKVEISPQLPAASRSIAELRPVILREDTRKPSPAWVAAGLFDQQIRTWVPSDGGGTCELRLSQQQVSSLVIQNREAYGSEVTVFKKLKVFINGKMIAALDNFPLDQYAILSFSAVELQTLAFVFESDPGTMPGIKEVYFIPAK